MKIITYNVNGLRAAVSKGLPEWLAQENPDILCLQETKLQPDQYPGDGQYAFPSRYPVGVVTGILGAPYLIYLLIRMNRMEG